MFIVTIERETSQGGDIRPETSSRDDYEARSSQGWRGYKLLRKIELLQGETRQVFYKYFRIIFIPKHFISVL